MSAPTDRPLADRVRRLADAHVYREALATLDGAPVQALPVSQAALLRARALAGLERYRAAHDLLGEAFADKDLPLVDRLRGRVLGARVLRKASSLIDDALIDAQGAARRAERLAADSDDVPLVVALGGIAFEGHLEAAQLFARKRCPELSRRELEAAAVHGRDARLHFAAGHVAAAFDERAAAHEQFEAALALATPLGRRLGHLGLAHVAVLLGEFDRAHGHLNELGELPSDDLAPRRLRLRVLESERRWDAYAAELADILTVSPEGDYAGSDRFERAAALVRAGQHDCAVAEWRSLADDTSASDHWRGRARRAAELASRPRSSELGKRRLEEFPSVAQLRNHCGPASVELYLRFFGLPAEQVEVARCIKNPEGGTPVYRMRRFLEEAGFTTRRIEADLPVIRRLIDAGIPVIMEEDYSDSRHVAVAVGYDDEREILEVQDPMSHEIRETPYEDLGRLRSLSNHGALVGVPVGRAAELEAAGAVECRYIAAVDEAWAAKDAGEPDKGDLLADEALGLRRDYELGWMYRFHRSRDLAEKSGSAEDKAKLHAVLDDIIALWPDDEWPQQLAGEVRYFDGKYDEALAFFERARDRDPGDAHNWSWIADCHLACRRDEPAAKALEETLKRNPGHRRANENLAFQAQRRGDLARAWILNDCARELGGKNPYNHGIHATLLVASGELPAAIAAYDRALGLDPSRVGYAIERAKLMARVGRVDEAAASLKAFAATRPKDVSLRVDLADLLHAHERPGEAAEVAREILALDPQSASGHAILGAALAAAGRHEEGLAAMRKALEIWPAYAWTHAQIGRALAAAGKKVDAVGAHAAAYGLTGRAEHQLGLARAFAAVDLPRDAERHARQAAEGGGLSGKDLDRAADLLMETAGGGAAIQLFDGLAARQPDRLDVARAQARVLLELLWAPVPGKAVLARIARIAPGDSYALAARGAELMESSLDDEAEGERLLTSATGKAEIYPRRLLARELRQRGRNAEALDVLAPLPSDYHNDHERLLCLLGDDRFEEAARLIESFEAARAAPGRQLTGATIMKYRMARAKGDLATALILAEQVSLEYHEREDDATMDPWETEKFECLVGLGELERARHFGERQAGDAGSLGELALSALAAGALELAAQLAQTARKKDASSPGARHVEARLAELAGQTGEAENAWLGLANDSAWHAPDEELARLCLGKGELEQARKHAARAIAGGHTCPWPFAVRAQLGFLAGDLATASQDLERAWALAGRESRRRHDDVWALRALLRGDRDEAGRRFALYLARTDISVNDRARVTRLSEAASSHV